MSFSAVIPAPPPKTWATVADLSRLGEWLTLHEAWRGEPPATIGPGTELTSVVTVLGLRNRIAWRVGTYAPPNSLSISGRGVGGLRVSLTLTVHPDDDHSDSDHSAVALRATITGPPTLGLLGLVVGRAVRTELRRSVAALAGLVG